MRHAYRIRSPQLTKTALAACLVCSVALAGCASEGTDISPETLTTEKPDPNDNVSQAAYWAAAYEKDPNNRVAAVNYTRALRQIGSIDKALTIATQASNRFPSDPALLAEFGKVLSLRNRYEESANVLSKARVLAPNDWSILSAQGVVAAQLERFDDATKAFETALRLSPNNVSVLNNYALSEALRGKLERAESLLRKAASQSDADTQVRQNLGLIVGLQGKFSEAERIALGDLPPDVAKNNVAYLKEVLTQPARWADLQSLDQEE